MHGEDAAMNRPAADDTALRVRTDVGETDWDRFVYAHPAGTVEHLWQWREIFSRVFRHRPVYLAAVRGNEIVGVLPLVLVKSILFGRSVVSLPYANYAGLVTSDSTAANALVSEATRIGRTFGASHVELRNVDRQRPDLPWQSHKVGARLLLPSSVDALWDALDRKVRNQVRKARKEGLTVDTGGSELVADFYRVFARNMRDLGTPVFPKALFEQTLRRLPIDARVHIVRRGTLPVAGAISLGWRRTVLVPWASALREYRALCANVLLYWTMLEAAVAGSYATFDFGRSTPGSGTHHFKQQWDAVDVPLHWEYPLLGTAGIPDHGPSNPRLAVFISAWQRLPMPVANTLGPEITRQLPG